MCKTAIQKDSYLHLYFHPWEFAELNEFKIPSYIKYPNGKKYSKKFDQLLKFLKNKGEFVTASEFLEIDKL